MKFSQNRPHFINFIRDLDPLHLLVIGLFSFLVIISNFLGGKCVKLPLNLPFAISTGTLLFPFTFFLTDLVTEIWGAKAARIMVAVGLILSFISVCLIYCALILPIDTRFPQKEYVEAFEKVFSLSSLLFISSFIGFLTSQFFDISFFQWLKKYLPKRGLWLRMNGASIFAQLIDTMIVNCILFMGGLNFSKEQTFFLVLGNFLYKVFCTLALTPFFYLMVNEFKKWRSPAY